MCLAIPGLLIAVRGDDPMERSGTVDFSGVRREVHLAFVPEVQCGDWVLVHVGMAIATIDESEALRLITELKKIDEYEQ
ncbi:MAG: HypC/HybG/HupF family hydrogenase formation chaperone [Planctomycetes bacterium]|nr:HypC/HybG/HupF family hydrogenase formation chaperone [Planctomycetota bacterium]